MKFLKLIILALLLPFFSYAQDGVVGDWKIEWDDANGHHTLKLTLASDGTYMVDMEMDSKIDIKGKYEMDGDKMTIQDTEGEYACGEDKKGVYQITASAGSMTMTRISEDCPNRGSETGVMTFTRIGS